MKKKGFTLIELLAVIVILAIIALITVPVTLNIIEDAKKGAFTDSAYALFDAYKYKQAEAMFSDLGELNVTDLDLQNNKFTGGTIKLENGEIVLVNVTDGTYTANGSVKNLEISDGSTPTNPPEPPAKKYTIVNDANSNGTADIGDEIALGDEHFYVISNDGTNINALAKYNLNVGGEADDSNWTAYTNPTGIQDSTMLGYVSGQTIFKGTTAFSSDSQKGTNYTDYNGSVIEGYVNDYVTYLNTNNTGLNATGRLILKEELEGLGCSISDETCIDAPNWVYSTSYWSGSCDGPYDMWYVLSVGRFYYRDCLDDDFGVRPVITIGA